MKPKLRSEELVKKDIKKRLQEWGAYYFMPIGSAYGKSGVLDFSCCVPVVVTQEMVGELVGLFVSIEAKAEGRRGEENGGASPLQVIQMGLIEEAQGIVFQTDTVSDLDHIEKMLHIKRKIT